MRKFLDVPGVAQGLPLLPLPLVPAAVVSRGPPPWPPEPLLPVPAQGQTIITIHITLTKPDTCTLFGMPEIIVKAVDLQNVLTNSQHGQALRCMRAPPPM